MVDFQNRCCRRVWEGTNQEDGMECMMTISPAEVVEIDKYAVQKFQCLNVKQGSWMHLEPFLDVVLKVSVHGALTLLVVGELNS